MRVVGVQVPPSAPQIFLFFKRMKMFFHFVNLFAKLSLRIAKHVLNLISFTYLKFVLCIRYFSADTVSGMTDPDYNINYYRIHKSAFIQKMAVFLALCVSIILMIFVQRSKLINHNISSYIARVSIHGPIHGGENGYSRAFIDGVIKKVTKDKKALAVIVDIDSPGGEVTASEELFNSISKMSKDKPTYGLIHSLGASGSYMAAIGCTKIYAQKTSLVGSIGVISASYEATDLAKKLGISLHVFATGKYKATGHPWRKMTEEQHDRRMIDISAIHDFFVNIVSERRKIPIEKVRKIADGSIYMGVKAKELGLVDEIGDEDMVLEDIKKTLHISKDIKIIDVKLPEKRKPISPFGGVNYSGLSSAIKEIISSMRYQKIEASL